MVIKGQKSVVRSQLLNLLLIPDNCTLNTAFHIESFVLTSNLLREPKNKGKEMI